MINKRFLSILVLGLFLTLGTAGSVAAKCGCICATGSTVSFESDSLTKCQEQCAALGPSNPTCTDIVAGPNSNDVRPGELENPLGPNVTSVSQIAGKIIQVIISLLGIISLCMFIYAGFTWLTAGGKPDAIKKGKETMIWAVAGLAVVFSSYIVLKFVFGILSGF
jgi:hypothetical protein